jgi:hypothetical protein
MPAETEMLEAVEAVSSKDGESGIVETLSNLCRIAPGHALGLIAGTRASSDSVTVRGAFCTAESLEELLERSSDVIARWPDSPGSASFAARYIRLSPPASRPMPPGHVAFLLRLRA